MKHLLPELERHAWRLGAALGAFTQAVLDVATICAFSPPVVSGESDVDELIEAALAHAKFLRQNADTDNDYGARATEAEADRWEGLARAAQNELRSFVGTVAEAARGQLGATSDGRRHSDDYFA